MSELIRKAGEIMRKKSPPKPKEQPKGGPAKDEMERQIGRHDPDKS